jgi:ABC-type dipeptide/oligopeptide/nickel transport system ATPase component
VLVMQHGRVVERGAPARVLTDPTHPYTRALVDALPGRRLPEAEPRHPAAAPA